ncbi:MAG: hypothetical protein U1E19_04820 [Rhodoblastus sp.]
MPAVPGDQAAGDPQGVSSATEPPGQFAGSYSAIDAPPRLGDHYPLQRADEGLLVLEAAVEAPIVAPEWAHSASTDSRSKSISRSSPGPR